MQKFLAHNYEKVQNEEKGYLLTLQMIKKEELYELCGVTKDMKIHLYEFSDPENMEQAEFTIVREINTIDFNYKLEVALLNEGNISKYEDMKLILLMQLAINIVLALFWMRMITHFLAEPLKKITGYLKESGFEDSRKMPDSFACMELNDVALHFNQMQERLKKEISQTFYTQQRLYEMELCEKNRELMAFQSQINPHFINNMLENIRVLANEGRDEDIDTVTVSMARFLRYSLYVKGFVTLDDELNAVKNYIEIMRICYDDMFTMRYELEEEPLRSLPVPKMILQPLIGNIFKHAFSFDHEGNCILLKVRRENDQLLICVYDNGNGMSAERLEAVKSELSASTLLQKDHGFGLRSVSRRLKTIYGDAYGVELNSREGEYTEITLKLPYEKN